MYFIINLRGIFIGNKREGEFKGLTLSFVQINNYAYNKKKRTLYMLSIIIYFMLYGPIHTT